MNSELHEQASQLATNGRLSRLIWQITIQFGRKTTHVFVEIISPVNLFSPRAQQIPFADDHRAEHITGMGWYSL
jgi:hypothetical protein